MFIVFSQFDKLKMAPLVLSQHTTILKTLKNITHKCPSVKNEYQS